jgi:hypothetical protein
MPLATHRWLPSVERRQVPAPGQPHDDRRGAAVVEIDRITHAEAAHE